MHAKIQPSLSQFCSAVCSGLKSCPQMWAIWRRRVTPYVLVVLWLGVWVVCSVVRRKWALNIFGSLVPRLGRASCIIIISITKQWAVKLSAHMKCREWQSVFALLLLLKIPLLWCVCVVRVCVFVCGSSDRRQQHVYLYVTQNSRCRCSAAAPRLLSRRSPRQ